MLRYGSRNRGVYPQDVERGHQLGRALVARSRILGERTVNDAAQCRRHASTEFRRRVSQDRGRQLRIGGSGKREPTCGQFIEHDAKGPDVGAEGRSFAALC